MLLHSFAGGGGVTGISSLVIVHVLLSPGFKLTLPEGEQSPVIFEVYKEEPISLTG